ncbi:MAG: tetratricopeptide repeat protein [Candidatus Cryptobacteroides sp.]
MKKIILAISALALSAGLYAQDLATATATYNSGAEALTMGNKTGALEYFQKALTMAESIGDEGADVVANCKNAIPSVMLSIGKELYNNKDFDGAVAKMKEAAAKAKEYGNEDISAEIEDLLPKVLVTKAKDAADAAFKAKDIAGAIAGYKEVLAADSTNAVSALRLGQLLSGSNLEEAEKYLNIAAANGQESNAKQVLGTAYLKKAAAQLKGGKYADAVALAEKANEIKSNAQALLIAGQASQKLGKDSNAISFFEKYLEADPNAKNASAIAFTVGALFQKAGNKSKALEYYQKVASDPQFGAQAKQLISALSK